MNKFKFKEFASRHGAAYRSAPPKAPGRKRYPNGFCVGDRVRIKPGITAGSFLYATIVDDPRNEQSATKFWAKFDSFREIQWDLASNYEVVEGA